MKFFHAVSFWMMVAVMGISLTAQAEEASGKDQGTGLPLPRYASLHTGEVNLRTGPGTRYPIDWVYKRKGMPVLITAEYDVWRRIKDWDGSEGWVHKMALAGRRTVIVLGGVHEVRKKEDSSSSILAHVEGGVVGQLAACSKDWCRIKFDGVKGYLLKAEIWGVTADEVFD